MTKPKVAVIGTGGTIHSIGTGPFDILDYGANKHMMPVDELISMFPVVHELAEIVAIPFKAVPSPDIWFPDWQAILRIMDETEAAHPDLAGFVVTHGTASMEETAFVLHLTARTSLPIVVTGSQRPASGISSDAAINLANAIRTAASPHARGMGAMLLLNDEIHCAREVTKTSTFRMQTFRSPDVGVLGHADGDAITFYRNPIRRHYPGTEFDITALADLPRVDIVHAYTGSDGTASRAFVAAGAQGIVSAGFAPGSAGSAEETVLAEAVRERGLIVVQSTRAGSGRTHRGTKMRENGFLSADNLNPQKARLLLALALTVTRDPDQIARIFATY